MSKKGSNPAPPRPPAVSNHFVKGVNVNPAPPTNVRPAPPPPPPKK
jgi:hypothetical protein